MRLLAPIQYLVIRSNAYRPFSWLNKQPYFLAISLFRRLCARSPEIHSAYLRHSLAEGRWEPGLSDIDLTILLHPGMTRESEFGFLSRFRRTYERIRRFLPILGELDILPVNYMKSWCLHSLRGRSVHRWATLCGTDFRDDDTLELVPEKGFDRLSYAFYFYVNSFLDRLSEPQWGAILEPEFLRRLQLKIEHYAYDDQAARHPADSPAGDSVHLRILRALEHASERENAWQVTGYAVERGSAHLTAVERADESTVLLSLLEGSRHLFAVVDMQADSQILVRCIAELRDRYSRSPRKLVILGPCSFSVFIGRIEPSLYQQLAEDRTVRFGIDLFSSVPPPTVDDFHRKIRSQFSMSLAVFPQGADMMRVLDRGSVEEPAYLSILERILVLRFVLENGMDADTTGDLYNRCQARFADVYREFRQLAGNRPPDLAMRLFGLYRHHLDIINREMRKPAAATPNQDRPVFHE
jgi:predicted nucleotidyltransferase